MKLQIRVDENGIISDVKFKTFGCGSAIASSSYMTERVKGLYAFRSIIDHGARITLGSDFPVEDMNPLAGFYAAITRVSPDGTSPHGPGGWCVHRSPALLLQFGHADSPM